MASLLPPAECLTSAHHGNPTKMTCQREIAMASLATIVTTTWEALQCVASDCGFIIS